MTDALTRRAVVLTALYGLGAPLLATLAVRWQQPDGWFVLTWTEALQFALVYYALPLSVLLWLGWAVCRIGNLRTSLRMFSLYGVMLPLVYHLAWQVPGMVERGWHAGQVALARFEDFTDAPLLSKYGRPIGIRLTYRVTFPIGLNGLGQVPPADAPDGGLYLPRDKSTLMYFVNRNSSLRDAPPAAFPAGTATIMIDAVPAFMPLAMQNPVSFPANVPGSLCFRWQSSQDRQQQLAAAAQPVLLERIGPYGRYLQRGSRSTSRDYRLAEFYQSALAEGAVECP